jgi:hypothetical protein
MNVSHHKRFDSKFRSFRFPFSRPMMDISSKTIHLISKSPSHILLGGGHNNKMQCCNMACKGGFRVDFCYVTG